MLAVATILYVDLRIVNQMGQPISQILHVIFLAFTVLYAMVFMYIYPVLAKFTIQPGIHLSMQSLCLFAIFRILS